MRAVVILMLVATAARAARADRSALVGSQACGACHPKELAAWQATAHARAALPGAAPKRCYACHGTGDAPAGAAYWAEVGCEACHGAGAAYAPDDVMRDLPLARALGLRDTKTPASRAAICDTCHRAITRLVPIDLSKPAHPIKP
ncbi:MAG TPA: multiheme c-type cytochrome [Kofleriaceae bacterium]|nr:multiheme c-type cytochrome [Kofleriaceae bacterium]